MNSRLWTGTSIILLLASFIGFAYLARRPLCIDSKVVERIDRVSSTDTATVFKCNIRKSVPYDEKWSQTVAELSRRIHNVERLLESLSPFEEFIHITVFEDRDTTFKVINHQLYIGEDLLAQKGALEKGILKIWFREKANAMILDHPLLEESLTDLLDFAINGELEIFDPLLQRSIEIGSSKWPFVAMTLPSYCKSIWRQAEHFQLCSEAANIAIKEKNPLVAASLRPLLTESLIASYLALSLGERKALLERLPKFLQSLDFPESGVGFTSLRESQQSLVDLSSELSGLMRNMENHADEMQMTKWVHLVKKELSNRGFSEQPLQAQTDLLVVLKTMRGTDVFSSKYWVLPPAVTALGYDQESLYLLPNIEGLDKKLLGRVFAQRVLYMHCGPLLISDLEQFFQITTKLLAVQSCDPDQVPRLDEYLIGDMDKFAAKNPSLHFIEIHTPSMALALKLKKLHPLQPLTLAGVSRDLLEKQLGWKVSDFDQKRRFYKVQSDIEAIRSYRP